MTHSTGYDYRKIADRLLCRSDTLRALPGDLQASVELAREMVQEQELFTMENGRTPYNTSRHLDALLAMIEGTALYLAYQIEDVIGEHDGDLPTVDGQEVRS